MIAPENLLPIAKVIGPNRLAAQVGFKNSRSIPGGIESNQVHRIKAAKCHSRRLLGVMKNNELNRLPLFVPGYAAIAQNDGIGEQGVLNERINFLFNSLSGFRIRLPCPFFQTPKYVINLQVPITSLESLAPRRFVKIFSHASCNISWRHAIIQDMPPRDARRTSNTELPAAAELASMLKIEAQRPIPPSKAEKHYPDFRVFIALLEYAGRPSRWFSDATFKTLNHLEANEQGRKLTDVLVAKLLSLDAGRMPTDLLESVYEYLSESDPAEQADLLFVPGSKTQLRIEKAVELYKQNYAPKLLISGGAPYYKDKQLPEAEWHKRIAVDSGVPTSSILTESRSVSLPDNVRSSLNMLDEQGISYGSILLVNSPYAQRRCWAHFMKYIEEGTKLIRINSDTKPELQKEHWYKSESGLRIITNEYAKMRIAVAFNSA